MFSANRGADWERDPQNSEVFAVDVATQQLTQLTKRAGPDNSPVVSPDGRKIAYLGFDDRFQGYQVTHLYVMDADGSELARLVTGAFDRDVENPRWSADGRGLYFSFDERGVQEARHTSRWMARCAPSPRASAARTSAGPIPREVSASRATAASRSR